VLDDILHGIAEAAGRVHGDQHQGSLALRGVGQALINIGCQDRLNFTVQFQIHYQRLSNGFFRGTQRRHAEKQK
jgi:hypothetical protein